jgi:Kef-type K+ transport system membrane component KefB
MTSYEFLLFLAIILVSTKVLGLFSRQVKLPAVVGALLAGIILGPSVLNFISFSGASGEYLEITAEIGVVLLMFLAGLETDISELKSNIVPSLVTAIIGVTVPLIGGTLTYIAYFHTDVSNYQEFLKAIFIGVVLTATSVSITVETLRELGRLKGKVGTTILGAAIIDDILGIIVLSVVISMKSKTANPGNVIVKILLYFVMIGILAFLLRKARTFIDMRGQRRRITILAIAFCFLLSYLSEEFFGIADITGAYFAGLMLCNMKVAGYIRDKVEILSYLLFSPVFFASIGIKTSLSGMDGNLIGFAVLLLIVAILTKVVGCGLGAKLCKYTNKESLQIGIGMISRGEVALIVAQKGYQNGMLDDTLFAAIVFVVIITTLITPILLKISMKTPASANA